jgi:hypothetical protein
MAIRVGDKLFVGYNMAAINPLQLIQVERITPSGRLVCSHNFVLNPDLSIRGAKPWGPFNAIPWNEALQDKYDRQEYISFLNKCQWSRLSTARLKRIIELL